MNCLEISSNSFFGIFKFFISRFADAVTWLLFHRAYLISTLYSTHREFFLIPPQELFEGVDYKIIWKPYYLRKRNVMPMILLKSSNGMRFSKITLSVEALNSKVRYQSNFIVYDVNELPMYIALPSIPFRKLDFDENVVYTPYDKIKTSVIEVFDSENKRVEMTYPIEKYMHPFDRLEVAMGLKKGDVERWGEVFNLEFLESELDQEQARLIGSAFERSAILYLIRKSIFRYKLIVKIVFWSKNIFIAKQLTKEYMKYRERFQSTFQK